MQNNTGFEIDNSGIDPQNPGKIVDMLKAECEKALASAGEAKKG